MHFWPIDLLHFGRVNSGEVAFRVRLSLICTFPFIFKAPSTSYSEEFQADFNAEYHKVYDDLRTKFLVGELAWNFADFMTCQRKYCPQSLLIPS